jgi:NAD(P)-dependent dehydrogenase (short-subunit alcohol dehydrogenase family)
VTRAAIVTGSDSGIGRATAVALARAGHDIGITWHTDEQGAGLTADLVSSAGRRAAVARLDLTAGPARAIDGLVAELGTLWALVNCAGANHRAELIADSEQGWRRAIEVNLTGPVLCAQAAARRLVDAGAGGRIVNVTSVHEREPLRAAAAYSAAKAGLGMATRVLALELAPHAITVNAVAPGHIATPMTGKDGVDPASVELPQIPLGHPGGPGDVAALIAFLVSDAAAYVTGASYLVDGGLLLTAAEPLQRAVEGVAR